MTHSDATTIRRLTGARVIIGRPGSTGARFLLAAYDATGQTFTAVHHPSMQPAGEVSAHAVLLAKREGLLSVLR